MAKMTHLVSGKVRNETLAAQGPLFLTAGHPSSMRQLGQYLLGCAQFLYLRNSESREKNRKINRGNYLRGKLYICTHILYIYIYIYTYTYIYTHTHKYIVYVFICFIYSVCVSQKNGQYIHTHTMFLKLTTIIIA